MIPAHRFSALLRKIVDSIDQDPDKMHWGQLLPPDPSQAYWGKASPPPSTYATEELRAALPRPPWFEENIGMLALPKIIVLSLLIAAIYFAISFCFRWARKSLAAASSAATTDASDIKSESSVSMAAAPTELRKDDKENPIPESPPTEAVYEPEPVPAPEPSDRKSDPVVIVAEPETPVTQMRATINIIEDQYEDIEKITSGIGAFGFLNRREINHGKRSQFIVSLELFPTEEQRAIILEYKLDELAIEDEPAWDAEWLDRYDGEHRWEFIKNIGGHKDPDTLEWADQQFNERLREYQQQRSITVVADYFNNPYVRSFRTSHEAHLYANKLKQEILPGIKALVEEYKSRSKSETFTV